MKGLNEKGTYSNATKKTRFPILQKLCSTLHANILKEFNKPEGLDTNKTRGPRQVAQFILPKRKHKDLVEVEAAFHPYGNGSKVFIISNDTDTAGLETAIDALQDYCDSKIAKKNSARTPNDGLRLSSVMLEPRNRGPVSKFLSGKKSSGRRGSDQSGDINDHMFEELLTQFMDPTYVAKQPVPVYYDEFPEEEKSKWDPNHMDIFANERTAQWLKETWKSYIKPKYKHALNRWNKDTGGGDGTTPSFIHYTQGHPWLVYVFCLDKEESWLLSCNACGRMPKGFLVESGFPADLSSIEETHAKEAKLDEEIAATKKQREEAAEIIQEMKQHLTKKASPTQDIRTIIELSDTMEDPPSSLSPASKALFCEEVQQQRKKVLDRMKERKRKRNQEDTTQVPV